MRKLLYVFLYLNLTNLAVAGLVTHTDYQSGSAITAAGQNANENTIFNEFNGSIDNTNIKSGGVASSNLASGAVTQAKLANGALSIPSVAVKTASYTVTTADDLVISSAPAISNTFTLSLPTAAGATGKVYDFIYGNQNVGGLIKITPSGSETIGGASVVNMQTPNESWEIVSDGTNWQVVRHKNTTPWIGITLTFNAAWGTTSNQHSYWRREGDTIHVHGSVQLGTVASASGAVQFPTSLPIAMDSAKLNGSSRDYLGINQRLGSTGSELYAGSRTGVWIFDGTNVDGPRFSYQGATNTYPTNNVNSQFSNSEFISYDFSFPVANWND